VALIVAGTVSSNVWPGWEFVAVRALFCSLCILVAVRLRSRLVGPEYWILWNLAVLFNPFFEFWLYERQRWITVDLITAGILYLVLHRPFVPSSEYRHKLFGFLVGVYVWSLVAETLLDGVSERTQELVVLPFRVPH
jgi:hypothetical protein